jgi:WD40 repeat protein
MAGKCTAVLPLALVAGLGAGVNDLRADPVLAKKAEQILTNHCFKCHGKEGNAKGGLNFILDRDKLVARQKLVPGKPEDSKVLLRVLTNEMPPESVKARMTPDEVVILRQWIVAGAPAAAPAAGKREFLSEVDVVYQIHADLKAIEPRHRKFIRYLSLANLYNAGASDKEMQTYRQAVSKLANSLSWQRRITPPEAVDPAKTLYRLDLRDYQWNTQTWNRILQAYPHYIGQKGSAYKWVRGVTETELPYVRADWFVANASRPPLYQDILQLPLTDRDLERQLRVDVLLNIQEERVARAGFNGSGIAKNNRMLERHESGYGAYWRSYDFSDNTDLQNLFEHPVGPQQGLNSFVHAGGEIIFSLPNGLQAYFVVDANGRRLDRAPIEIVSDPKRRDKLVETGISCMSCHVRGLHPKTDQIRAHVEKNPNAFGKDDVAIVKAIYPPEAKFKALMDEDIERFVKAVAKTGAPADDNEPILALTLRYEGELDLAAAAAEVGFKPEDFTTRLSRVAALARPLGPLNVKGGTVQRQVFLTIFPDMLREFGLGDGNRFIPGIDTIKPIVVTESKPFEGHTGHVLCIDYSKDGKRALSGGDDNTARLWDVETGREIRPLEGHTDEVLAVAISADGKRLLTGGADRTTRLWDANSGRQLKLLEGHTERVSAVAFSPDGKRALTGSWDHSVSLWNLETGEEIRRLNGHRSYVTGVAFSPDGKRALSGSYDRTIRLWDVEAGKPLKKLEGHTKEIYTVAFSPDGKHAVSGGNDQVVRVWDLESGKSRAFEGHSKAVIKVAFSSDGHRVYSGSSQYQGADKSVFVWDVLNGRVLYSLGGKSYTVWSLAFSPDGRRALAGTSEKTLRLWEIPN